jgi:hypothetical protein
MKNATVNFISVWLVTIAIIMSLIACSGTPKTARTSPDELDIAIRETSDYLNERIPNGNMVAFINISGGYPDLAEYILGDLSKHGVNDGVFSVVDRTLLNQVREELKFNWSGEVDDSSAQEIGRMLGAQTIVSGSVRKLGSLYRLEIKAIEVQTARVQGQWNKNVPNSMTIAALTATSTGSTAPASSDTKIASGSTTATTAAPAQSAAPTQAQQPAAPALPAYKVGDTGPAGGLIFYDKGNNLNGWRYLEAAPEEAEFRAIWSVHKTVVDNTQANIGRGIRNTQLIVAKFRQTSGEWDTAAQKANDLVYNGFDDWFLPSKDELDQMYGNLKRRNLGDFKDEWYWASDDLNAWGGFEGASVTGIQSFKDGTQSTSAKTRNHYVRPIRQVAGQ